MVNLDLHRARPVSNDLDLGGSHIVDDIEADIFATITQNFIVNFIGQEGTSSDISGNITKNISANFESQEGKQGSINTVVTSNISGEALSEWDANAHRGPNKRINCKHDVACSKDNQIEDSWDSSIFIVNIIQETYETAIKIPNYISSFVGTSLCRSERPYISLKFEDCIPIGLTANNLYVNAWRAGIRRDIRYKELCHIGDIYSNNYFNTWKLDSIRLFKWEESKKLKLYYNSIWQVMGRLATGKSETSVKWQDRCLPEFIWPYPDREIPIDPGDPINPWDPVGDYESDTDIDFICLITNQDLLWVPSLGINFSHYPCGKPPGYLPIRTVYFVTNSVSIVRLPDRVPLSALALNISASNSSWCWSFTMEMLSTSFELIKPDFSGKTDIEITINGIIFIFVVESYGSSRQFGGNTISLMGRSRSAYLADPYAAKRSFTPDTDYTSQQLANLEVSRVGFESDFTIDWGLPIWLVDAGAYSFSSLTPMSAIKNIVESVGGYVQSHLVDDVLIAKPAYPYLPWTWDALVQEDMDKVIPEEAIYGMSLQWVDKPDYNGIYIMGEYYGVTAFVKKTGTAGDYLAPQVINSLITHVDAARERGETELGDTGQQAEVSFSMPVMYETGLIAPGEMVEINADEAMLWRGLVRGTSIKVNWTQNKGPVVDQSVKLERHYYES